MLWNRPFQKQWVTNNATPMHGLFHYSEQFRTNTFFIRQLLFCNSPTHNKTHLGSICCAFLPVS